MTIELYKAGHDKPIDQFTGTRAEAAEKRKHWIKQSAQKWEQHYIIIKDVSMSTQWRSPLKNRSKPTGLRGRGQIYSLQEGQVPENLL